MLAEFSEVLRSLFSFFFCITPLLALLPVSSLPTPRRDRLNFKSKCSFSFQRECLRCGRSRQRVRLTTFVGALPRPLAGCTRYCSTPLDWTCPPPRFWPPHLCFSCWVEESIWFFFFTWEWFDDSLDPGTAACCNDHCTFHATEVWSLPSSVDSVPSDVWMGLCWIWSRLPEPNVSLLHTEHNLYSLLLAHTCTNSKHRD